MCFNQIEQIFIFLMEIVKKLIHETIAITIIRVSGRRTVTAAIKNDNNNMNVKQGIDFIDLEGRNR